MKIPNNWGDVTPEQLLEIKIILDNHPDNAVTQAVSILSLFTGQPKDHFLAMNFTTEFKPLVGKLDWMATTPLPEPLGAPVKQTWFERAKNFFMD